MQVHHRRSTSSSSGAAIAPSGRDRKTRLVVIACCAAIVLGVTLTFSFYLEKSWFIPTSSVSSTIVVSGSKAAPKLTPISFPEAKSFSSRNDTAYVFLGLGATAHQLNCEAAIESLVRYGGWGGRVYLVTDQERCYDRRKIVSNAGMRDEDLELLVLKDDFGGFSWDIMHPAVGFSKNRLKSKSMKTQLFHLIPDPQIEVLAYADCDILFTTPQCPLDFVTDDNVEPWEERNIRFSRVEVNATSGRMSNLHAGTIVMHREHSAQALQHWFDRINMGVANMDRHNYLMEYRAVQDEIDAEYAKALSVAVATGGNPTEDVKPRLNVMLPGEKLYPGTIDEGDGKHHFELFINPIPWEEIERTTGRPLACMVHISKARCDAVGRDVVQEYVDRFHLHTYEGGYPYCIGPRLEWILYGWFPISYMPVCTKLEYFG